MLRIEGLDVFFGAVDAQENFDSACFLVYSKNQGAAASGVLMIGRCLAYPVSFASGL